MKQGKFIVLAKNYVLGRAAIRSELIHFIVDQEYFFIAIR